MADQNLMGSWYVQTLEVGSLTARSGTFGNATIATDAAIASSKLMNRIQCVYAQMDGANHANTTGDGVPIYVCDKTYGTTIKKVTALCPDVGASGSPAWNTTVDVYMFDDSANTSASILSAPIYITEAKADYEIVNGSLNTTAMALGDVLLARVTIAGANGTAHQGLLVQVEVDEQGT